MVCAVEASSLPLGVDFFQSKTHLMVGARGAVWAVGVCVWAHVLHSREQK